MSNHSANKVDAANASKAAAVTTDADSHASEPKDEEDDVQDIHEATLAAVHRLATGCTTIFHKLRMVQEGSITAEDAMRHAEFLNQVRVRKKGDAQRILLMNMVKVRVDSWHI